jgi:hypothetical protein
MAVTPARVSRPFVFSGRRSLALAAFFALSGIANARIARQGNSVSEKYFHKVAKRCY